MGLRRRGTIRRMIAYGRRLKFAFRSFFSILDHGRIPDDVTAALVTKTPASPTPAPAPVAAPVETGDRATQLLALLQRDGRLLDFVMEDLAPYQDAQIGAAARDVHAGCRQVLSRYVSIAPVMADEEGQTVTIERGADPARIKVIGNVAGEPPYQGVLRHRGWEATRMDLPPMPTAGRTVLSPAEVEVP
jgi:hypothetical protein